MKTYRVTISDEALEGVERYLDYIEEQSGTSRVAARWWEKALAGIFSLETMPHRCPLAPEDEFAERTIRVLIVDKFLFLYTIDEEDSVVRVLDCRHGSQQPRQMNEPE
ncbi:MAG: type II toxin-antitoxin system RelE/ParE family toxin [Planctomycetota bacterium]